MNKYVIHVLNVCMLTVLNIAFIKAQTSALQPLTAAGVIDRIREQSGVSWSGETVDVIKAGNPATRVTGIAVCFTATMDVLRQAVEKDCNMIITHEPTFYNHLDQASDLAGNSVFEEKEKYIGDHGLVIFRFHDHIHRMNPDGIEAGMIEKLGLPDPQKGFPSPVFKLKETTVGEYVNYLSGLFGTDAIRCIRDPDMKFTTLGMVVGAPSSSSQINMLEEPGVEVVLTGESREWETVEYARDAVQQGRHKALIITGHALSEEAGMVWCTNWLERFITEVPVVFIPAGEPFISSHSIQDR